MKALRKEPRRPKNKECQNSYVILKTTYTTCSSFFDSFKQVRRDRNARGVPTDREQDLLRAMIIFSSSGLDATIKQLVLDALPNVIGSKGGENGAANQFRTLIKRELAKSPDKAAEIISMSLTSESPRESLVKWLQYKLRSESLQSKDQVFQIASFFDIRTQDICKDINLFESVFKKRNKIIHELDIDFSAINRNRIQRVVKDTVEDVNEILDVSEMIIHEVDKKLS